MVSYTDSWLPLPVDDYQKIQNSLIQYGYNDVPFYVLHAVILILSVLSCLLNCLIMAVFFRSKNIRTSNSGILTFQLAFSELCHSIVFFGTPITFFIKGQASASPETCFIATQVSGLTTGVWLMTLALSAFDRYMTIVRQKNLSKFRLGLLMALIWIATFLFSILPVFAVHFSYYKVRICGIYCGFSYYDHTEVGIVLSAAGLIYLGLPNQAISSCYSAVIKSYVAVRIQNGRFTIDGKPITDATKLTLWQTYRLINDMGQSSNMTYGIRSNTNLSTNDSSQITKNLEPQLSSRQRMELLVFRKSVTTFVVFNICWLPLTIASLYELISGTQVSRAVDTFVTICTLFSGLLNSYLNLVLDERFKTELREMLGYKK